MISANAAMTGYYDYAEVARSVLVAIAASYAALDLTGRVTAARGGIRLAWLSGGAVAMGIGIWAMHFKGMLAFHLPVSVEYHWPTALAALLVAILASAVALYVASRQTMGWLEALTGSVIMGAGIAGLHYIAMAAMRLPAITRYSSLLVTASLLLAVLFSLIALLMAFDLREESRWTVPRRLGSAIVMGAAVSAMHYTGMAAASFIPAASPDLTHAVSISAVGNNAIGIVILIVLVAAMVTSSVDRRAGVEAERINQELERRVAERTSQLEAVNQALRKEITERKRAEEALREREKKFYEMADNIHEIFWMVDATSKHAIYVNPAFEQITGRTVASLLEAPLSYREIIHPDDRVHVLKSLDEAEKTGVLDEEFRIVRSDGTIRWAEARGFSVRDAQGKVYRLAGVVQDITERKRAEDALRESEDRYRDLVEHSQDLLCTHDLKGKLLSCNPAPARILGYEVAELLKIPMQEIIAPEFREQFDHYLTRIKTNGEDKGVMAVVTRTGERRIWEYHNTLRTEGVPSPIVRGMARDITDRKRAETALRRSEENYRMFVAQSSEGIFRQDVDAPIPIDLPEDELVYRILHDSYLAECNDAIARMYGLNSAQEFIGKRLTDTVDPTDPRNIELTREYVRSGFRVLERESHEADVHGNPKIFLNSMIGIVENGKLVRTWGIQRDITARRHAEQALQKAHEELARVTRIATLGELTASIAHEINQPLGAVATNASAALRWLEANPPDLTEAREAMAQTIEQADLASEVIKRARLMLQKSPPERRPLEINDTIREALALSSNELLRGRVTVRTEFAADLPAVLGDRVQLRQVMLNLILNAIEAMSTVTGRPRMLWVKSGRAGDDVEIHVQDSGIGLKPEELERIFDPFVTTKAEGIGMGLSISRSIVVAHGGRLWATSGVPHGACFQFRLPVQRADERVA